MKTFTHVDPTFQLARSHPWTQAKDNPDQIYYDFRKYPAKIRTSLEDFIALGENSATTKFYDLVEWINSSESHLESNDCGAGQIRPNTDLNYPKSLACTACLMILYRDLTSNLSVEHVNWLQDAIQHYLKNIDTFFDWAVIGTTLAPANYINLPIQEEKQLGRQIVLTFWAWGDNQADVLDNLSRAFTNTMEALIGVNGEISASINSADA